MTWLDTIVNLLRRPRVETPTPTFSLTAGMRVSNESAMQFAAVWACVRIISETIATLGWHIVREDSSGRREREVGTAMDILLNARANAEMTAFAWREVALMQALLRGNHYSEIGRDSAGRPNGLWPMNPDLVKVDRNEADELIYRAQDGRGREVILPQRDVLHIKGITDDGIIGLSVVAHARRSIGVGLALDEFGASFYGNGAHVGAAIRHPGKLSQQAKDSLKAGFQEAYAGPNKAHKTVVLEEGMDVTKLSMSMVDAQFLESRKFQVSEICRWFRVPPHKVADLDRATFSNIEHQSIEFVQDTILPWCRRLEQEVDLKLFGQWQKTTRLNIDTLLRGDIVSRFNAYEKGRLGGWLSANDVRRLENLNPIENGDIYLQPMNYQEAGAVIEPPAPAAAPREDDAEEDDAGEAEAPSNVIRREALEWRRANA